MLKRKKPLARRSGLKRTGLQQSAHKAETCADKASGSPEAAYKLWSILRDRDVAGLRFRQRERVGPYLVDFLCPAARFIIQLEGSEPSDQMQTEWLREHGYRVLLVRNADVLSDSQRVLDSIAHAFEFRIVSRKN